jgi:hypothetical protein
MDVIDDVVDTLQTGYPRVQASSQDKGQDVRPRVATCPIVLDQATLLGWAPPLPRVLRLRTPPLNTEGLRHCHMSHGSGSGLASTVDSGAAVCRTTPDPASLRKCRHMSHGSLRTVVYENKE